jgi:hypothetical protein
MKIAGSGSASRSGFTPKCHGSATLFGTSAAKDGDPDPSFHFNADPDPTFHFNADLDPDPAPHQCNESPQSLVYRPSRAPL